ncbi:MAG: beta-propeller domain-containing protein, partial [Ignavibacteriales bacterium]
MEYSRQRSKRGLSSVIRISLVMVLLFAFALVACYPASTIAANSDGVSYKISGQKITLSWGQKPTAGYKISINSVKRSTTTITVSYSLTAPSPGAMTAQVITYPKATASIPKGPTPKKVVLVRKGPKPTSGTSSTAKPAVTKNNLPVVGSASNLQKLLAEYQNNQPRLMYDSMVMKSVSPTAATNAPAPAAESASGTGSGDYSKTNVQVQGVDEADIIKTDGSYIYQVNDQKIYIIKAKPADKMTITDTIAYTSTGFSPAELYVDASHLVVIGSYYESGPILYEGDAKRMMAPSIMPPRPYKNTVRAIVYDIRDKKNVKKVREVDVEGSYVSSRKIGSSIYLVANKWIDYYTNSTGSESDLRPSYKDTAVKNGFMPINYTSIRYFPGCIEPNYIIIAGLDLNKKDPVKVETYLGPGQNIYCSDKNLYVAASKYNYGIMPLAKDSVAPERSTEPTTNVYRFALNSGSATFSEKGEVPGTILNQFSMDENDSYFRIATTTGDAWRTDEGTSKNNIYVLNSNMSVVGKLENIAPGEKIYSTRFLGNRVYMVTFKTVDPFFVIDLKNPKQPKILGALKIPGFSDYLHPYDENHVIGFGKDTIETKAWGDQPQAFYMGMKVAIFDVTNVAKPVEMFKETIGDRGTDSELLRNHKALLFSKEKNLLAFPVTVMKIDGQTIQEGGMPAYGNFSFQGAYVYNIDLVHGFKLKGRITHLTNEDYVKAGQYWYDDKSNVERIMYIGNDLYTMSKNMIKANNLS